MPAKTLAFVAGVVVASTMLVGAQSGAPARGYSTKTTYVALDSAIAGSANAILMEPATPSPNSHIVLVYTHIGGNQFSHWAGPELSKRGYRVLLLNHYGSPIGFEGIAPSIAQAVKYLRGVPGIDTVVLLGHSGGGPLMSFYQNLAENGPKVCQGPEKIYPCRGKGLDGLPKADGLVLLDSHVGTAFTQLTYTDPAIMDETRAIGRHPALDMFNPKNGYDSKTKGATYGADFTRAFFAAQGARNEKLIANAQAQLAAIEAGQGAFTDDVPFNVPGSRSARLLQPDPRLLTHTRVAHPLLKPDGTTVTGIVPSVRPPMGPAIRSDLGSLPESNNTTVRRFLAEYALRTTKDYGMTEDAITGVEWASSNTTAVSNIEGVTVPLLVMSMTCHYFLVPDELIFDHAASKDKQIVFVEGASHVFAPCRQEFGDTVKRLFDYADKWLSESGRFGRRSP
jgi:pimeloyl-ACP methyl ester carboxylesterase